MAKQTGLGDNFYIGGYDLSGDVSALNTVAARRTALEMTAIDKFATERQLAIRDGEINFNTWWDNATDQEHDALKALPTTDRIAFYVRGPGVGNPVAALLGKQIDYNWQRGQDGSLAGTVQALSNGVGIDWGDQLTVGKQTFVGAGSGSSIDFGAVSTAFGAVGYLQVLSVGTGTATVAIQDSADNGSFANIIAFTGATARTQERIATATGATIRRYVRVNVTGSFTNAVIAVAFTRFEMAQS